MKKKIRKIIAIAAFAFAALQFFGCSELSDDTQNVQFETVSGVSGRVAFTCDKTLSNITLKGKSKSTSVTATYGAWKDSASLESDSCSIPVGSYTFTLSATYDGNLMKGTCDGEIKENETTPLEFTLKLTSGEWAEEETGGSGTSEEDTGKQTGIVNISSVPKHHKFI